MHALHVLLASGPVAQWIRHRLTEPGIAGSSPAGVILALLEDGCRCLRGAAQNASSAHKSNFRCSSRKCEYEELGRRKQRLLSPMNLRALPHGASFVPVARLRTVTSAHD